MVEPSPVAASARSSGSTSSPLLAGAAAAATVLALGSRTTTRRTRRSGRIQCRAASKVETFLVQGPLNMSNLAAACAPLAAHIDLTALAFFSLGVKPDLIASVAGGALGIHGLCPVYIADCYGIIGWDKKQGKNVELMELGRGKEYGGPGGQGGEGVVVVAFRGSGHATSGAEPTAGLGLHLLVTAHGQPTPSTPASGAAYGGVAKAVYKLEHSGDLVQINQFAVSSAQAVVTSFDGDAASAATAAVGAAAGSKPVAAGYFPCFCRGYNKYKEDGVEPAAFEKSGLSGVPLFGMFAHGELGPAIGSPVSVKADSPATKLELHSETSVLALYA